MADACLNGSRVHGNTDPENFGTLCRPVHQEAWETNDAADPSPSNGVSQPLRRCQGEGRGVKGASHEESYSNRERLEMKDDGEGVRAVEQRRELGRGQDARGDTFRKAELETKEGGRVILFRIVTITTVRRSLIFCQVSQSTSTFSLVNLTVFTVSTL